MAQTKEQFLAKVQEMLPELNKMIMEKAAKAYQSGAIDPQDYEDNYLLPKIFMAAMGKEMTWQYMPHDKKSKSSVENLSHFL